MKAFLRHLRVPVLITALAALGLGGCVNSITGPAQRRTDLAVTGGIGGAAIAGLATAAITRNPWIILGAAGAGLVAGGLGVPYVVETFFQQRGNQDGDTLTHNGTVYRVVNGQVVAMGSAASGYGRPVVSAPVTASAGYGYGLPQQSYRASTGGLPVDNPVRVRACQPTAQAPARAMTSNGIPWVSCGRPGAGPELSFR